jgi:hypothetical protein
MPRHLALPVLLLAVCAAALAPRPAPAAAATIPVIGIGEQKSNMFVNKHWAELATHDARYNAPWDTLDDPAQLALLDDWLIRARLTKTRPLIGFTHSLRSERLAKTLPTQRRFEIQFKRLRKRYPWVRDYIVWNEANNPGALTAYNPRRAAQYFDAVTRNCRGCRVVAADVLDTRNMPWWVSRFVRNAKNKPKIWGLHNYGDVNGLKVKSTQRLLKLVKGKIWFTETGGLVSRRLYSPDGKKVLRTYRYTLKHAAQSTRHALKLACSSTRVQRVYLYHWQAPRKVTNWDSGLLDHRGKRRPAFYVVKDWLARSAKAAKRGGRSRLCRGM